LRGAGAQGGAAGTPARPAAAPTLKRAREGSTLSSNRPAKQQKSQAGEKKHVAPKRKRDEGAKASHGPAKKQQVEVASRKRGAPEAAALLNGICMFY
jgi:hypothetical protein